MKWIKKGLIYKANREHDWNQSHSQVPKADLINDSILRIYFGTRDENFRTLTTYIEVEPSNPQNIIYIHNKPVIELGKLGCFDDCGVMPSCILKINGEKYMYYTGWNTDITVSYRLAIGLAVSEDNGVTFKRIFEGPVIDRSMYEPFACCQPFVMKEDNLWRMWYSSFTEWKLINGKTEPFYNIKYGESKDGIHWNLTQKVSLDYDENADALGNPCVWKENGIYKMFYSYRKNIDYRTDPDFSYRIGYAESDNGSDWVKKNDEAGIDISKEGWDSKMIAYPNFYEYKGQKYLLYNGDGFGKSGFGYAILKSDL